MECLDDDCEFDGVLIASSASDDASLTDLNAAFPLVFPLLQKAWLAPMSNSSANTVNSSRSIILKRKKGESEERGRGEREEVETER